MMEKNTLSSNGSPIDWSQLQERLERVRTVIEGLDSEESDRTEEILRSRAVNLARTSMQDSGELPVEQSMEVLVFRSAGERYAFETTYVSHVCPIVPITPIPGVPDYIVGIMAIQGEVVSVMDLRSLLDLPMSALAEPASIIVLKGNAMEFGILAEAIEGIERHPLAALEHVLPTLADKQKTYLKGVTANHTAILDAEHLLSDPRLVVENA